MGSSHQVAHIYCMGIGGTRRRWLGIEGGYVRLLPEQNSPNTEWIIHHTDTLGIAFQNRSFLGEKRWLYGGTGAGQVLLAETSKVNEGQLGAFWISQPHNGGKHNTVQCRGTTQGRSWFNGLTKDGRVELVSDADRNDNSGTKWQFKEVKRCREEYLGFLLKGAFTEAPGDDFLRYQVVAFQKHRDAERKELLREVTTMRGWAVAAAEAGKLLPFIAALMIRQTFSRVRARLVLDDFDEGAAYEGELLTEGSDAWDSSLTSEDIQSALLHSYHNVRQSTPPELVRSIPLVDLSGIRLLLRAEKATFDFGLDLLMEKEYLQKGGDDEPFGSPIWITATGIESLKEQEKVPTSKKIPRVFTTAFGEYKRGRQSGSGGCGTVFAVIGSDGDELALKLLDKPTSIKEKRFKNEMRFCLCNDHPNIVRVLDYGVAAVGGRNVPFYIMPHFSSTLRVLMKERIASEDVLPYFNQILSGIEAAHDKDIAHRDLKPENILHNPADQRLVIADFGIAHFVAELQQTTVETKPDERLANWMYAAPEQRSGGDADRRSDIYALGLILNEMFTGKVPWGTGFKKITDVAPSYSHLDELVDWMMQNDKADRPQTVGDIRKFLERNE